MELKKAAAEELLKRVFPNYRLGEWLGSGSYGKVYAVEGTIKGAPRAVKFLSLTSESGRDSDGSRRSATQRLTRDWRNICEKYSALHACGQDVVQIYEIGEEALVDEESTEQVAEGFGLVLMDRWPGNLRQFVLEHELTVAERRQLFREVVGLSERLHRRGLLFEDLKPQNVLVKRDGAELRVCAGDIGGLKSIRSTSSGSREATMSYAAPEVVRGGARVDETALIFTLGLMGFLIFETRECYGEGDDPPLNLLERFASLERQGPDFGAGTDGEARELIGRCLQVERGQRLGTFAAVLEALNPAAARIRQVEEESQRQLQEMAAKLAAAEMARDVAVQAKADAETARKRAAEQALQEEKEAADQEQRKREIAAKVARELEAERQVREAAAKSSSPPASSSSGVGKKVVIAVGLSLVAAGLWAVQTPKGEKVSAPEAPTSSVKSPSVSANPSSSLGIEFVRVAGGNFQMGCGSWQSDCYDNEKPVQSVMVGSFELGKYEVTQGQWRAVMGSNPSYFSSCGDNCPVEQVSWNDAQKFIEKLNARRDGCTYRLPTEAEWEYACRSGGKDEKYCGGNDVDRVAWYDGNSGSKTHPVGGKAANGLGLYDMSGNVWEWTCSDWGSYSDNGKNHAKCSSGGSDRVFRGGSWYFYPALVRSASRSSIDPGLRDNYLGLRLSRTCP